MEKVVSKMDLEGKDPSEEMRQIVLEVKERQSVKAKGRN